MHKGQICVTDICKSQGVLGSLKLAWVFWQSCFNYVIPVQEKKKKKANLTPCLEPLEIFQKVHGQNSNSNPSQARLLLGEVEQRSW